MLICVLSVSQPVNPPIKQPIKQAPDAEVLVVTTAGAQKTWPPAHPKPMARPMLVLPTLLPMLPTVVLQGRGSAGRSDGVSACFAFEHAVLSVGAMHLCYRLSGCKLAF